MIESVIFYLLIGLRRNSMKPVKVLIFLIFAAVVSVASLYAENGPVKVLITKGMTLSEIAKQYYGSADSVVIEKLIEANPEIRDVDLIFAGDSIILPEIPGYKIKLPPKLQLVQKAPSYMTITRIGGSVKVIHSQTPVPVNPVAGEIITGGDRIIVEDSMSWVELEAENGLLIRVSGEAIFDIKQLFMTNNGLESKITLIKGAAWFNSEASSKDSYIEVKAGKINAVSRHTKYSVYASDGGIVKVLSGEVEVALPSQRVVVKSGQEFSDSSKKVDKLRLTLFEKWNIALDEFKNDQTPPYIAVTSPGPFSVTNKRNIKLEGKTEPGATVFVNDKQVPVDSNGLFAADVRLENKGLNVIEVKSLDLAGNVSILHRVVVLDLDPPVVDLEYPPDSEVVRAPTIKVLGTTEPGASVEIDGQSVAVAPNGYFEKLTLLQGGWNTLKVVATDSAGNTTVVTRNIYVDTQPPSLHVLKPKAGTITNNPRIEVVASTDTDAAVVVGTKAASKGKDGRYHMYLTLQEGPNAISVKAVDKAGNLTLKFVPITVDLTPPQLVLGGLLSMPVTLSSESNIEVVGTTEPDATITVNGMPVKVSDDGQFFTTISLKPGINHIVVQAVDEAGNKTVMKRTVKYVRQ